MNSRQQFPKGSRVRHSKEWVFSYSARYRVDDEATSKWQRKEQAKIGTVLGWSRDKKCVRVHWDGQSEKSVSSYHFTFIEVAS